MINQLVFENLSELFELNKFEKAAYSGQLSKSDMKRGFKEGSGRRLSDSSFKNAVDKVIPKHTGIMGMLKNLNNSSRQYHANKIGKEYGRPTKNIRLGGQWVNRKS